MFYDVDTRELLRTCKNPLTAEQIKGLKGQRPAGPPPRPSSEPIRVQRRASNTGVIMAAGQKVPSADPKHQTDRAGRPASSGARWCRRRH
jgi:hypothetical protein